MINLKVKTLDSQTYEFAVDNETTVRQFKETIAEKTKISADSQRIIYCGRVLVDEKKLKEYDVNGKTVHVVERPPPSQRTVASSSSSSNENTRRRNGTQIRGTPIFRNLDGMVVGTMTIPMNGQVQGNIPALNPSSFCMNRITVARHMLDCVNNIITYLENPERGLNNSTLDILTQGRYTMESTVVEVGISTTSNIDLTQNQTQNFMDVFHGALSAALRNDRRQNVTVLQLPSVYSSDNPPLINTLETEVIAVESNDDSMPPLEGASSAESASDHSDGDRGPQTSANNNQEQTSNTNGIRMTRDNSRAASGSSSSENNERSGSRSNSATRRSASQQRTRTRALSEVVEQMRSVQVRLEPYVQQYYDILQNEPQFEENDTVGRENAQRIFDRVSEAMHYMSHALHAISDLMLDLSQNTPRYLSCRPILVEQGGFVSSNNYLASFVQPTNEGSGGGGIAIVPPVSNNNNSSQQQNTQPSQPTVSFSTTGQSTGLSGRSTTNVTPDNSSNASGATTPTTATAGGADEQPIAEIVLNIPRRVIIPSNPQLQVARLIQAVVNSAPMHADLHVQINAPNVLSVGIPIGAAVAGPFPVVSGNQQSNNSTNSNASSVNNQQSSSVNNQQSSSANNNNPNNAEAGETQNTNQEQPRVTTATHPTTSTQTRSTPRPQVHVANMPSSWSYRDNPDNTFSSFDRFLPCSSHHIREPERENPNQNEATSTTNDNNSSSTTTAPPTATVLPSMSNIVIPNFIYRNRPQLRRRRTGFNPTVRVTSGGNMIVTNDEAGTPSRSGDGNGTNNISNRESQSTQSSSGNQTQSLTPRNNIVPVGISPEADDLLNSLTNDDLNFPMTVFGSNLTLRDIVTLFPSSSLLNRSREEMLSFVVENFFGGNRVTEENMSNAVSTVIQMVNEILMFLPQFDLPDYDARASVENFLRQRVPPIINLINDDTTEEFGSRFLRDIVHFAQALIQLIVTAIGRNNAELYFNQIIQLSFNSNVAEEQEPFRVLHRHIMSMITRQLDRVDHYEGGDIQSYLVIRRPAANTPQPQPQYNGENQVNGDIVTPMETDDFNSSQMLNISQHQLTPDISTLTLPNPTERPIDEPLPQVNVGSETWHGNFPASWLPIITRDTERQRRQLPQPPFSDAYISGMSAKRRKLISNSKSPTEISLMIADGVKKSIKTSGINISPSSSTSTTSNASSTSTQQSSTQALNANNTSTTINTTPNVNEVSHAIASDALTQSSYIEALRNSIQDRLRSDENYDPQKFPNSSKYFSK